MALRLSEGLGLTRRPYGYGLPVFKEPRDSPAWTPEFRYQTGFGTAERIDQLVVKRAKGERFVFLSSQREQWIRVLLRRTICAFGL